MTLNDLELSKLMVLVSFFRFWAETRISKVNCAKMARDRPKTTCVWNF